MKRLIQHPLFLLCLRILIGGLFIYSGAMKIMEPQEFADSIAMFRLLPAELTNLFALSLPPFEILVGGLLVTGWQRQTAAFSILVLTAIFALALGQALARGLSVDCGCFGSGTPSVMKTWLSLGRDFLLMPAAWLLWKAAASEGLQSGQSHAVCP